MERNIFDDLAAQQNQTAVAEPSVEVQPQMADVNGQFNNNPGNQPSEPQNNPEKQPPTPQQSFQEMRQKNEQLQRERDEALRVLQQIEQYALQQQQQQVQQVLEQPYVPDYSDDDLLEGRHLKQEMSAMKKQFDQYRQQQDQWLAQQQSQAIELQLKAKYNDFDKVVTHENIAKLRELRPEIASSLHQSRDLYNKASATYTILKELGIYQEDAPNPEAQRIHQNTQKPRPVGSIAPQRGESPLSQASAFSGDLSDADKRRIYANMVANSKRR